MKPTAKGLLNLLKNDNKDIFKYEGTKYTSIDIKKDEILLLIVLRHVFCYKDDKLSFKELSCNKTKYEWLNTLIQNFYIVCTEESDNFLLYAYFNKFFSLNYSDIFKNYGDFVNSLQSMKFKVEYDLFACLICFLSYLNGNKKYLNILPILEKNKLIKSLKETLDEKRRKNLWVFLTNYCSRHKIPILYTYDNQIANKEIDIYEINEINCFADICPINDSYKKLVKTLYSCLKDYKDLRENKTLEVKNFIQDIFVLLNVYLQKYDYLEDYNLSIIYGEIYSIAYEHTSKDFNENYIDFVVNYVTKYDLSSGDFFHLFMNGLIGGNFNTTFENLNLQEDVKDISDKETIQTLINKMNKRKIKNKKTKKPENSIDSINIINNDKNEDELRNIKIFNNVIQKDADNQKLSNITPKSKSDINQNINEESKSENNAINEQKDNKFQQDKNKKDDIMPSNNSKNIDRVTNLEIEFKQMQKEMSKLKNEMSEVKAENKGLKNEISKLKEKNEEMENDIDYLNQENDKKDLKISKTHEEVKILNKCLVIIGFRDLSKRVLDNMINFVSKKNAKIFQGLSKRKEKLKKINNNYQYDGIQFMKKPIEEIAKKYYDANSIFHVPEYVKVIRDKPYGLDKDPAEDIAKKYYNIIVKSKDEKVFDFMKRQLFLKKEIDDLYLKNNN